MKKQILKRPVIFILSVIAATNISAQENDTGKKWSSTISFSPVTTFYYYHPHDEYQRFYSMGVREIIYPFGLNLAIGRNLDSRLAISSGLNFKVKRFDNHINIIGEWSPSYYEKSTDTRYIFEVPVSLSYRIAQKSKRFEPFLRTGLRGSYFRRNYDGEFTRWDFSGRTQGVIDNHDGRLIIFCELGTGSYVNIYRSISLMIGSNLTYSFSGFGYMEFQAGLSYSFKEK